MREELVNHLAELIGALHIEIDLHGGRTEMARNLRLNIINVQQELERA
jgi:hypothetical protein